MPRVKEPAVEATTKREVKRSISMHDVVKKEYVMLDIPEEWVQYIGRPEENFRMLAYGESGGGKTTFVMRLCVMLAQLGKVYYNSAEEGEGSTIKAAAIRVGVPELCQPGTFMLGDRDSFEDMYHKLSMKRAARFCVIDSLQYMVLKEWQIKKLMADFPRKAFIVVSWATPGGQPKGAVAKATEYMFDIKVMVNNGSAVAKSRYGATVPYEVYPPRPKPGKEAKRGRPAKKKDADSEPELFGGDEDAAGDE